MALHDRPALREVLGILALCAVLLAGLAKMDNEAAREYQARAQKALAAQQAAQRRAGPPKADQRPAVSVEARTESLGGRGPISIPVGAAWTAGTSAAVAHTRAAPDPPAVTAPSLRRIVGPTPAGPVVTERPAASAARQARPATVARSADPARRGGTLLAMMAACGLLMATAGALILGRSR